MCVTVLVSHPSVSIETETTQRMCSPGLPVLPIVLIVSLAFAVGTTVRHRPTEQANLVLGCAGLPRSVLNVYLKGRREPGAEVLRRADQAVRP